MVVISVIGRQVLFDFAHLHAKTTREWDPMEKTR
jgi:hypothetical protein